MSLFFKSNALNLLPGSYAFPNSYVTALKSELESSLHGLVFLKLCQGQELFVLIFPLNFLFCKNLPGQKLFLILAHKL